MVSSVAAPGRASTELLKRRQLAVTRRQATGLLVVMTAVFVVAHVLEDRHSWLAYVRATAEASMVGGLADWFAVTALFRRPLGLPIPHTAVIVERKDAFGRTLGNFVQEHFLTPDVVIERIRTSGVPARLATWLCDPDNADTVARHAADLAAGLVDLLHDDDVHQLIEELVIARLEAVPLAPAAGRALELATADDRHQDLLSSILKGADRFVADHRDELRARFEQESPWWVPETIDNRIFDKLFSGVRRFLHEVGDNPEHALRRHFDQRVRALAADLVTSPAWLERGEQLKADLLANPALRTWSAGLWADLKATLKEQAGDPHSELRRRLAMAVQSTGQRLAADRQLQASVLRLSEVGTRYVLDNYQTEIADLVSATVARWDAHETADRLELLLGPDLQFIRINGTIVGGLAGLVIYSVAQVL